MKTPSADEIVSELQDCIETTGVENAFGKIQYHARLDPVKARALLEVWRDQINDEPLPPKPIDPDEAAFVSWYDHLTALPNARQGFFKGVEYARETERERFADDIENLVKRYNTDNRFYFCHLMTGLRAITKGTTP